MKTLGAALLVAVAALAGPGCSNKVAGRSPAGLHANPAHASHRQRSDRQLIEAYGRLPLSFEANKGQSDPRVDFQARGPGYAVFLTPAEAVIVVPAQDAGSADRGRQAVVTMKLIGASPSPAARSIDAIPGTINYFRGNQRDKWTTNIPQYARVQYDAIYPGIDVVYYGQAGRLEHDFIVAPGADPGAIGVRFEGAESLEIDDGGDLVLHVAGGEMRLPKPHIYQPGGKIVTGSYVRNGEREIGFDVGVYDRSESLIIDPVLVYSTHLGGGTLDDFFNGSAIAVDASGSAYITGQALAFPTTPGSYQPVSRGNDEAFVAKLASDGSRLIYATFIGGSSYDLGSGIAVDAAGRAYVTGQTFSSDFPTTPGGLAVGGRPAAGFVAQLSADGSALLYSTLLAGSASVSVSDIAVDSGGNAYVTGERLGSGAFVTKLNATGTGVVYSIQIPADRGRGIAVDDSGSAYVTGDNAWLQATPGVFQATPGGGNDAFVIKLHPGGAIAYATHLGGSGDEFGTDIAIDPDGNAYVTGGTTSTNFPVTAGAFQDSFQGLYSGAAFVSKVNPAGSALLYSTLLALYDPVSNTSGARGSGIAVDGSSNVYVTGTGRVPPVDAFETAPFGSSDVFVAKLNPAAFGAASLVFATGLGGDQTDQGHDIAVDSSGNTYISGRTRSTNFMTVDPLQPWLGGGFAAKIAPTGSADLVLTMTATPEPVTLGSDLTYTLTVTNAGPDNAKRVDVIDTVYPDVVSFSASQGSCSRDPYAYNPRPIACELGALDAGRDATVTIVVAPSSYTPLTNSARVRSNVSDPDPTDNSAVTTTLPVGPPLASLGYQCADFACVFFGLGSSDNGTIVSYEWDFGDGSTGSDGTVNHTYADAGTYTVTLTVTDNDGLTGTQVATVTVPVVIVTEAPYAWFDFWCDGTTCTFDASYSWDPDGYIVGYDWDFGDGTTESGDWWINHTFTPGAFYTVTLTVTDDQGQTGVVDQTFEIGGSNVAPVAAFTATCSGVTCTFDASGSSDADGSIASYIWDFGDGTSGSGVAASRSYAAGGSHTVSLTVADNAGATGSQTQVVTLANSPPVAAFTAACSNLVCSFNGSGSSDADGTIASYVWSFGDGQAGSGPSVSHAYGGSGSYAVTLTVADNAGATHPHSANVTVNAPTLHVGDLDAAATGQQNTWTATVIVTVHDGAHAAVANATVNGSWSNSAADSCTTAGGGQCMLSAAAIPKRVGSLTFTVAGVSGATSVYTAAQNHDPDGESEGTRITVVKQ